MGFRIYFGISDMLVHQHGTLLKIAGWVVFHLHGFIESLKHLFRSDSSAQYKDVIQGSGFHAPVLASRLEIAVACGPGNGQGIPSVGISWQHLVL